MTQETQRAVMEITCRGHISQSWSKVWPLHPPPPAKSCCGIPASSQFFPFSVRREIRNKPQRVKELFLPPGSNIYNEVTNLEHGARESWISLSWEKLLNTSTWAELSKWSCVMSYLVAFFSLGAKARMVKSKYEGHFQPLFVLLTKIYNKSKPIHTS